MQVDPKEYCFAIHHDSDLGGFYAVLAKHGEENIISYDHSLVFTMPMGFYPLSPIENLYGFAFDPSQARQILLDKGFTENLDLI